MENNKGQTIFLSVVGIATLLVAIVGATFAYFSISVEGNETASSIIVTTAIVGGVTFDDGQEIKISEIYPGWSDQKTFTISNREEGATDTIDYNIELIVKDGSLPIALAAETPSKSLEFFYTLTGTVTEGTGGATVNTTANKAVPTASTVLGDSVEAKGTLNGETEHTYIFVIEFDESNTAQDYAQGKSFAAVLQVNLADGTGARTWDQNARKWKNFGE